ncbi:uncharacterized protein LOC141711011 [Apium graveolens]|uniref:uncharacterized protein LOC141711011 n=1 Tax=Apium graveolens TaxID=4045 RepID=UPI003D7AD422
MISGFLLLLKWECAIMILYLLTYSFSQVMKNLLKHKLLHHDSSKYDGFRLTYLGYDFLAIKMLVNRRIFTFVGRQIGVRKELASWY